MVTAAQRAADAQARQAAAAPTPDPDATTTPDVAPDDPDADLLGMSLMQLRTEAKRLMGADYDRDWGNDKVALLAAARGGRQERRDYYASQRKAQVEHARAVMRGADE